MSQKYSQDEAQALVKALKEGNQLAFSIVYKTYAAQTFSLAFKYLLNKELAEDAVQNLFLKLWLKKEEIDETKPINRYLFTMLKGCVAQISICGSAFSRLYNGESFGVKMQSFPS